jgi:hypothetical protein
MKKRNLSNFTFLLILIFSETSSADFKVKELVNSLGIVEHFSVEKIIDTDLDFANQKTWFSEGETVKVVRDIPAFISEYDSINSPTYRETIYAKNALPELYRKAWENQQYSEFNKEGTGTQDAWSDTEVRTIVEQGPSKNRINLTIVGDGYTLSEKNRFFEDAKRITDDLFSESTFASYLMLFNVYAVFVPSKDSGITDVQTKNTIFGLYRTPKGSKRAIMPGNTLNIERALRLAPASTDYPIVLANDDFYGGLGGRYAISTRSVFSGSVVLRHELGHNFGNVGEEYDGGQVYSGANNTRSASLAAWQQWVAGAKEIHQATHLKGFYSWENLSKGPINVEFDFSGASDESLGFNLSSVGWNTPDDVEILINNKVVPYKGVFTKDRSFFDVVEMGTLKAGKNILTVREKIKDGDNVLAFVRLYSYPANYRFDDDYIGGFATYAGEGSPAGFRPTDNSCLMRNMLLKKFCAVDIENMWNRFLAKVSLIDAIDTQGNEVKLLYPQLSGTTVTWLRQVNGQWLEMTELKNLASWKKDRFGKGQFSVEVNFVTPEVRKYNSRFKTKMDFTL